MRAGRSDLMGMLLEQRYRIGAPIARGGMSTVYRGVDTRLDRPVAIKVMDPRFSGDPQFLARFEFEARSVAKLKHPGLVAVHDQGHDGDYAFLVMELIEGGTLRELLRERGPMPPHAVRAVAEPVLAALGVAHGAGLVHRDIKPENILISEAGEVKIADFGLVRAIAAANTTSSSVILGTAAYLSPEQVRNGTADARSDVYSFGILMFEMLTGHTPFNGDTSLSVAYQRLDRDVERPSEFIDGVPVEFDALVAEATARDPAQRFADGAAMAAALHTVAEQLALPAYRVPAPRPVSPDRTVADSDPEHIPGTTPVGDSATVLAGPQPTRVEVVFTDPPSQSDDLRPATAPPRTSVSHRKWLIWLGLLIVLAVAVGIGGWFLGTGNYVAVPSVEGMNRSQAEQALRTAGFTVTFQTRYSDGRPAGNVLGTDPAAGDQEVKGSSVALLISGGRPRVPTPSPGSAPAVVEAQIRQMGLNPVEGPPVYTDSAPSGTVAALEPAPGTVVPAGSTITVQVSRGSAPDRLPDLRGHGLQEATDMLADVGAKVGNVTDQSGNPASTGNVVSTDPAPGTGVGPGSVVDLTVSTRVRVPFVMLRPVGQAITELQQAGLRAGGQIDDGGRIVIGQTPGAWSTVAPGTTVRLCTSLLGC